MDPAQMVYESELDDVPEDRVLDTLVHDHGEQLFRQKQLYIHRGGIVEERDRGPSCCEQFVFSPRDREG